MKIIAIILLLVGFTAYAEDDASLVARYLKYQTLPRITEEKIDVAESVRALCFDPKMQYGPHIAPGIHIYASASAIEEKRRVGSGAVRYPIGSLFVKEKFDAKKDVVPSIITVMEKVSNTGSAEDWRFSMIRISDRAMVRDGFKVSCVECHSRFAKSDDFVSSKTDLLMSMFAKK